MDAADRKTMEATAKATAEAISPMLLELQTMAYRNGFDAGKSAGIEEGRASAAGLIAGLRNLLGKLEGFTVPAGLPPMVSGDQILDAKASAQIREQKVPVSKVDPDRRKREKPETVNRELVDLSTGEIIEEPFAKTEKLESTPDLPGCAPLDTPLGICNICRGFGTIEGELYGEPCLVPCICEAGVKVAGLTTIETKLAERGDLTADEIPEVKKPAAIPPVENTSVVVCDNAECEFFSMDDTGGCSVPAEERAGHPLSNCPNFKAATDPADAHEWDCCKTCNLADPDCPECFLVEAEIDAKQTAQALKPLPAGACRHNMLNRHQEPDGSVICDDCGSVIRPAPASCTKADGCTHFLKTLGKCSKDCEHYAASLAPWDETPAPAGESQTQAEPSPAEAKKLALQAKCPHPDNFMQMIAGRGEVCTICDLTLTAETLPLWGGAVEVEEVPAQVEPVEECDHLPLDVRCKVATFADNGEQDGERETCGLCGAEIVKEIEPTVCEHPADSRQPSPTMVNGEKVGSHVKCGLCERIVARFDNSRKPIPAELWPENGGTGIVPVVEPEATKEKRKYTKREK